MRVLHMQISVFVRVSLISCLHRSVFGTDRDFMIIDLQRVGGVGVLLQLNSKVEIRNKFFEGLMHEQHDEFGEPVAIHFESSTEQAIP